MWLLTHVIGARLPVVFLILMTPSLAAGDKCPNVQYGGGLTFGGPDTDVPWAIAVDSSGNRFVAGSFQDTVDFDPTEGVDLHSSNGSCDAFVTKLNSDGTYGWTVTLGGTWCDLALDIGVDDDGTVVAVGHFSDTVDFDPGEGIDEHTSNGDSDAFVAKFLSDGSYSWARTFGGKDGDLAISVAVDAEGNVFTTGNFLDEVDLDPSEAGEDVHYSEGDRDVFVTKFTGDGDFIWAKTFGGPDCDHTRRIAMDPGGALFVTGHFVGTSDFDPSDDGESEHTSNGGDDIYVTKLDVDGSYEWTATIGGAAFDISDGLAVDAVGSVIFSGNFISADGVDFDPTDGVDERANQGEGDIFASKLTGDGDYEWTWTAGGSEYDFSDAVGVDTGGNVYIAGRFGNPGSPPGYEFDFDASGEGDGHISNGGGDAFITQLAADGSYGWTRTFGGPGEDVPKSLAVDLVGNIQMAGYFTDAADLDPTEGVDIHVSNGGRDIFVTTLLCTDELPCDGDANGDGLVDPLDSGFVLARFGCAVGTGDPDCDSADMNGDALVDPLDVGYVLARFGTCE